MPRRFFFRPLARVLTLALVAASSLLGARVARAEPVTLVAVDGVKVFGEVWRAAGAKAPIVLAFHQADSSSAEYAPIGPRLVAAGFTVLAIDQRSGNGAFGGTNRTAAALGRDASYDEALPDLEAALAWAKANGGGAPVVVIGSSYSAALVFVLAAAHAGEIAAIAAYSPGEYLNGKRTVRDAAARIRVPVLVDQASSADEIAQSKAIVAALKSSDKRQVVARPSTHGASTLRADANAAGAEAHWAALLPFLARFNKP